MNAKMKESQGKLAWKHAMVSCKKEGLSPASYRYYQIVNDYFAGFEARDKIAQEREKKLVEALEELCDLMDDVNTGDYKPDTFTTQPARKLIANYKAEGNE